MSGRFQSYVDYSPCINEWIKELPSHWEISSLGFECSVKARLGWKGLKAEEYVDDGYIFLATPNIKEREIDFDNVNYITEERYCESPEIMLEVGDVLVTKDGSTTGTTNLVRYLPTPTTVNSSIAVLRTYGRLRPHYLFRFFTSDFVQNVINRMRGGMGVPHLFQADLKKFFILVPPPDEQKQIAAFLDYETAKIDALIEKQQQLIALLREKRQAVISHAVTKGLNPDAPMRDSGVEWLGDVPEHWRLGPLKRFWPVIDCKHITVPFLDEGHPVASVMEVRTFELDLSRVLRTDKASFNLLKSGGREPKQGDVIYCRNTANTGTSAYVGTGEPVCIGQDVVLIKSRTQNGRFLNYILHGPEMAAQLAQYMVGSTFKRINVADIRELIVTCPPRPEQDKIVDYLDSKAGQYDELIGNAEEMVEVLQERRVSLISAAVTGKIDVRGWQRPSSAARRETEMEFARILTLADGR